MSKPAIKPAIQPSPAPKSSNGPEIQLSTSKVWVVPPRPKPGRKPASDTPPTKRKAQNRAAQRAFRERKAQKVDQLQDQLHWLERERQDREMELVNALETVRRDNERLHRKLAEIQSRKAAQGSSSDVAVPAGPASPAQPAHGPQTRPPYQVMTPASSPTYADQDLEALEALNRALEQKLPVNDRCSVCIKDSCVCESLGLREKEDSKPSPGEVPKRTLPAESEMEIDFTEQFMSKKKAKRSSSPFSFGDSGAGAMPERCGFCAEGMPCMCSELDDTRLPPIEFPEHSHSRHSSISSQSKLPTLDPDLNRDVLVPIPSPLTTPMSPIVRQSSGTGSPLTKPSPPGCSGDPGNCTQCRADPMSTLFCTTLASHNRQKGTSLGSFTPGSPAPPGTMYIPCSAAYQTLSRHKDFGRADLGKLVGKLHTRGMQVEVSSVASVLRQLDRKLYD